MNKPKIEIDINKCDSCGACMSVCTNQAIIMKENITCINQQLCNHCSWCSEVCPMGAIVLDGNLNHIE